jgi:hypothetical protein
MFWILIAVTISPFIYYALGTFLYLSLFVGYLKTLSISILKASMNDELETVWKGAVVA